MDRPFDLWVGVLVEEFPDLSPIVSESIETNGELLGHMLFGDIVRWVESSHAANPESAEMRAFVARLDTAYPESDWYTQNVLDVSFVENLGPRSPILSLLGPNLREVAREMFGR